MQCGYITAEDNDPTGEFVARWVPECLRQRFGFQTGIDYPTPNDFEAEARHWKKMLYEFHCTPDAREASQAIVDKLASQRRPTAQRAKKAKTAYRQQLSLV